MIPRQQGVATLGTALLMLLIITFGAIVAAHLVGKSQRAMANEYRAIKAAEAAEAGLEWGMAQLLDSTFKQALVVDKTPPDGLLDSNSFQAPMGLLPSDLGFKVSFTNPVANNLKVLTATSVGCADGCSPCDTSCPIHRTVQMEMQISLGPAIFPKPLRSAITAKGKVSLTLNAKSTNLYSNQPGSDLTVWSGSTATYSNGAGTVNVSGNYNASTSDPGTKQNDSSLASASTDQFFQMFFGGTQADIQKLLTPVTCGATCNTQLNGVNGQALWITTNLVLSGTNTIGTPSRPVLLITTHNCQITESSVIYGVVYCNNMVGTGTATKVSTIYGGVITQNDYTVQKVPDVVYDPGVMSQLVGQFGGSGAATGSGGVGRLPGSWRDLP